MSPAFSIIALARCTSRRACARRVARSIVLLLRAAVGAFSCGQGRAVFRDSLTQGGAGLVVGETLAHERTIKHGNVAVAGSVAGVLPCAR